jgi:hypothetical protein
MIKGNFKKVKDNCNITVAPVSNPHKRANMKSFILNLFYFATVATTLKRSGV